MKHREENKDLPKSQNIIINQKQSETMSSHSMVSGAKPTLHIRHPSTNKLTPIPAFLSLPKSRISIKNPTGSGRTRPKVQIHAFYAPAAETTSATLYEVLGITESGTLSDIKKAYKQMARKYHPDVSPPDRVDEYTNKFIMVNEAYQTLSNPQSRVLYDQDLAGGLAKISHRRYNNQRTGESSSGEWRMTWQSQLDVLKKRSVNKDRTVSWSARMRNR